MTESDIQATETAPVMTESAPVQDTASVTESTQVDTQVTPTEAAPSQLHTGAQTNPQAGTPAQPAPQAQQAPVNWEKRYKDQQPYLTKLSQERADLTKRYDGIDPDRAREALAEMQRRQEVAQASPFSRRHPEYSQNKSRIERAELAIKATEGMERDEANRIAARMGVTTEDLQMRNQANAYRQQQQEQLFSDPDTFIAERVESLVNQKLSQQMAFIEGRTNAEKWLSDPKHDQIVKNYAPDINRLLDGNMPLRDKVAFLGEKFSELDALKKQLGQQAETVAHADAQKAALGNRSQGSTRRGNVTATRVTDAAKYVKETLKLKPGDPKYIQSLQGTNDRIRSGEL